MLQIKVYKVMIHDKLF